MPGPPTRREERLLRSLALRKHRDDAGLFLAEGIRAVEDLLASPLRVRLAVASSSLGDDPRGATLQQVVEAKGLPLRVTGDRELRLLAGTEHPQGILAVAELPRHRLADLSVAGEPAVLLLLDAVQDPGNLGTLVRTAEALGALAVLPLPGSVDAWNPKAVRAAMGSSFRLPVIPCTWEEAAPWLREHGFTTVAAVVGSEPLPSPPPRRVALVLGNEGAGVGAETLAHADLRAGVALRGRAESLNVAAAGALLLHELLR
ncbi:MAG TPA: RNA methyltransferase [Longimicrobiaceae bacterium]|nr:RNA methyltransferase [Longimicrobiaceae bacterium]